MLSVDKQLPVAWSHHPIPMFVGQAWAIRGACSDGQTRFLEQSTRMHNTISPTRTETCRFQKYPWFSQQVLLVRVLSRPKVSGTMTRRRGDDWNVKNHMGATVASWKCLMISSYPEVLNVEIPSLVGGLEYFLFFHILGIRWIRIPTG